MHHDVFYVLVTLTLIVPVDIDIGLLHGRSSLQVGFHHKEHHCCVEDNQQAHRNYE